MISNILKLVWNKRKRNFLIITEMLFLFLIIFIVSGLVTSSLKKYYSPLGFNYHNVIMLRLEEKDAVDIKTLSHTIKQLPEAECVSVTSGGTPFKFLSARGSLKLKNGVIKMAEYIAADDNMNKVLSLEVVKGRWFNSTDDASSFPSIVINKKLKDELFNNENPIGKNLSPTNEAKIVGVIEDFKKYGEFRDPMNVIIMRDNSLKDPFFRFGMTFMIKARDGKSEILKERLAKITRAMYPGNTAEIASIEDLRDGKIAPDIRQLIVFLTIGVFMIINVALGLFGILWYNVNRRRKEIGIRRAVGADRRSIYIQVTGETLLIVSASVLVGCLFAFQFPAINIFSVQNMVYITAILAAILFIYIVAALCAVYPSYLASRIEPAETLHDD